MSSWWVCFFVLALCAPRADAAADGDGAGVIVATSALGEDLSITIDWSSDITAVSIEVVLFDESGASTDSQIVSPVAGDLVQYVVSNFLSRVPVDGFQFSIILHNLGGDAVSARHAFRVFFDCSLTEPDCMWETVDGLEATAPTMRFLLVEELDAVADAGSTDVLADLLVDQPDLAGQVVSLASQLDRMDSRLTLGQDCFCSWFGAFLEQPGKIIQQGYGHPSQDELGWQVEELKGKGATLALGGQALSFSAPVVFESSGSSRLNVTLRCWRIAEWTAYPVSMAGGLASRWIRFPKVLPCLDTCLAEITFSSQTTNRMDIGGLQKANSEDPVFSGTTLHGSLMVLDETNNLGFVDSWDREEHCAGTGCSKPAKQLESSEGLTVAVAETMRGTGHFSSRVGLSLRALGQGQWSLACSNLKRSVQATGTSDCAVEEDTLIGLAAVGEKIGDTCGELAIEPWDP